MGGCLSVQISCDQVLKHVGSCFCGKGNYTKNLEMNLVALEKSMEDLKAMRDDLLQKVQIAEDKGLLRLHQIKVWLTRVVTIENHFNDLNSARNVELQRLCFCGVCSKNLRLTYIYGRRVFLMLQEVRDLKSEGFFEVVAQPVKHVVVEERPIEPTIVGQETVFEKAWRHLMDDEVRIMGLYGMGGVGKTTLLTEINNRFCDSDYGVDIVVWVVVSSDLQIHKIQEEIGEKIGFKGEEWNRKRENHKAVDILNFLKKKRFVLLLDDIWKKVELSEIGIPNPTRGNKSKIVFTTRSQSVCASMGVHDPIEVQCLTTSDAWDLFQEKVGPVTLGCHPDIPEIARQVAEKCCGLPLALNVIGETMASKRTRQEWDHALAILTTYAANFNVMEENILPILKYSYDNLHGEQMKSCFLYCSLFPEDCHIDKEGLIDYWIGEGFIDETEGRERALNQGYEILGTLIRACLLLEGTEDQSDVSMHDVIREMALWIASDLGKHKERCVVRAGVSLREVPIVEDWRTVKRMSLMNNEIEVISGSPHCPELRTLFLHKSGLVNISSAFFRSMPRLVVLDLSRNLSLCELPEQITELVSLRYLNLSYTNIARLPFGLYKLTAIIKLNLGWMKRLGSISGISKLLSLRSLSLELSGVSLDINLVKELELLKHLEVLTVDIKSSLVVEQLLSAPRLVRCIQMACMIELEEESFSMTLPAMDNLRKLFIWGCGMREIEIERATPCFSSLCKVVVKWCDGLKDLTWLLFAPNLTYLDVVNSEQVEDIINEEKNVSCSVTREEVCTIIPFQKLEYLHLSHLPKLKNIYRRPLPFQCLKEIKVNDCPELRRIPLGSTSGVASNKLVIKFDEKEWMERIEWEDEATKQHFLPSCKYDP